MSAGLPRVGLTLDSEATHGARPPRRQESAASKHDTSSNTLDAGGDGRGTVYNKCGGEGETAAASQTAGPRTLISSIDS